MKNAMGEIKKGPVMDRNLQLRFNELKIREIHTPRGTATVQHEARARDATALQYRRSEYKQDAG